MGCLQPWMAEEAWNRGDAGIRKEGFRDRGSAADSGGGGVGRAEEAAGESGEAEACGGGGEGVKGLGGGEDEDESSLRTRR